MGGTARVGAEGVNGWMARVGAKGAEGRVGEGDGVGESEG